MASMAAVAAATAMIPSPSATSRRLLAASSTPFFHPLKLSTRASTAARLPATDSKPIVRASSSLSAKERAVTGLTAAAVAAALLIPDIAEAAQPGLSPSLKNFLLSIVSGGVVLTVIIGVVIGVSSFDPVKRG